MAKLILHIGDHKTGSTAIQKALFSACSMLAKSGILYPETGLINESHHAFAFAFKDRRPVGFESADVEPVDSLLCKLNAEILASNCETVILSSEVFISFNGNDFADLGKLFGMFDEVLILAYLRNQVDQLESSYRFNVSWGEVKEAGSFEDYVQRALQSSYHEYDKRLGEWSSRFPDAAVIAKDYTEESKGGNLIARFVSSLGFPMIIQEERANDSLGRLGVLLFRLANRLSWSDLEREKLFLWLKGYEENGLAAKSERLLTQNMLEKIRSRFFHSNEELNKVYGIDLNSKMALVSQEVLRGETIAEEDLSFILKYILERDTKSAI